VRVKGVVSFHNQNRVIHKASPHKSVNTKNKFYQIEILKMQRKISIAPRRTQTTRPYMYTYVRFVF
jgi:hypothetical protein